MGRCTFLFLCVSLTLWVCASTLRCHLRIGAFSTTASCFGGGLKGCYTKITYTGPEDSPIVESRCMKLPDCLDRGRENKEKCIKSLPINEVECQFCCMGNECNDDAYVSTRVDATPYNANEFQ